MSQHSPGDALSSVAHFRVFIDGEEVALRSISPLQGLVGDAEPPLRQAVTLTRASGCDRRLFDWYRAAAGGKAPVREVRIAQLECPAGAVQNVWVLKGAVPVRWTGPYFDALANDIAMEELEVRYESIAWRHKL